MLKDCQELVRIKDGAEVSVSVRAAIASRRARSESFLEYELFRSCWRVLREEGDLLRLKISVFCGNSRSDFCDHLNMK